MNENVETAGETTEGNTEAEQLETQQETAVEEQKATDPKETVEYWKDWSRAHETAKREAVKELEAAKSALAELQKSEEEKAKSIDILNEELTNFKKEAILTKYGLKDNTEALELLSDFSDLEKLEEKAEKIAKLTKGSYVAQLNPIENKIEKNQLTDFFNSLKTNRR